MEIFTKVFVLTCAALMLGCVFWMMREREPAAHVALGLGGVFASLLLYGYIFNPYGIASYLLS
jgi:hypothetical protein